MTLLSWFDNRTLLTCLFLVAAVFAVQFLSLRRARPAFRGMGSVAFSLILGAPGLTLFYLHGFVSDFLSGTIASLLILGGFVFLYQGISQFLGDQRFPRLLLAVNGLLRCYMFLHPGPPQLPRRTRHRLSRCRI